MSGGLMKLVWFLIGSGLLLLAALAAVLVPGKHTEQKKIDQISTAIVLRMGHNTPLDSALHEASVRFAQEVERKSDGRLKIVIYPSQQLGNDHQMVELARSGNLDIILTPTAKMSVAMPSMQFADLPFYFPAPEDVYSVLDGEPGRMLLEDLRDIGLVGVTFWENGFKHFTANSPLLRPEDFKGKKMRVMKSRIIMEQFRSLGAIPIPIDFHATRAALKDGVVDGEENPLVAIVSMGFHEVQTDLTLSSHAYLGYVFSISARSFAKLPLELRNILVDTAKEVTPWEREQTHQREVALLEKIRESGVHIHELDPHERERFAALMAHIAKKFESVIGSDVMSKTEALLGDKYTDRNAWIIGIDADLSMDGKVVGLMIKRGVELAVERINAAGGLLGHPVRIIAKDHRALGSRGIENIREFAANPKTIAIIGGLHSAVIADEMEEIQKLRIPYLVPWAAASETVKNGYEPNSIFRLSGNDDLVIPFLMSQVLKEHHKPAVVAENSSWGRGNLEKIERYLLERGIENVPSLLLNRGQKNILKETQTLLDSGADAIIMIVNSNEGGVLVNTLAQLKSKLPLFSHWGITGNHFFEENQKALAETDLRFFQPFAYESRTNPKAVEMLSAYRRVYGKDELNLAPVALFQAYDVTGMLVKAVENAQTTQHDQVRTALESIPFYEGAIKSYRHPFSPTDHDALENGDYVLTRFGKEGQIVPEKE